MNSSRKLWLKMCLWYFDNEMLVKAKFNLGDYLTINYSNNRHYWCLADLHRTYTKNRKETASNECVISPARYFSIRLPFEHRNQSPDNICSLNVHLHLRERIARWTFRRWRHKRSALSVFLPTKLQSIATLCAGSLYHRSNKYISLSVRVKSRKQITHKRALA